MLNSFHHLFKVTIGQQKKLMLTIGIGKINTSHFVEMSNLKSQKDCLKTV